jgi:hypothetical protein
MEFRFGIIIHLRLILLLPIMIKMIFPIHTHIFEFAMNNSNMPITQIKLLPIDKILHNRKLLHLVRLSIDTALYLPKILVEKTLVDVLSIFVICAEI